MLAPLRWGSMGLTSVHRAGTTATRCPSRTRPRERPRGLCKECRYLWPRVWCSCAARGACLNGSSIQCSRQGVAARRLARRATGLGLLVAQRFADLVFGACSAPFERK